ncbi:MAG TPA: DUF397 domain-containing protein [Pseudonocardiaceae bacterium]|nr:DUF397 domain-containing protein [Pseudonocardiaceae bacterium]
MRPHTSSHSSGESGSDCVEVAFTSSSAEPVWVRDSKNTAGPTLAFPSTGWHTFLSREWQRPS